MIDMLKLKVGDRLRLQGGLIVEVVENMGDGEWVKVCPIDPDGKPRGSAAEELCHYSDIVAPIRDAPADGRER